MVSYMGIEVCAHICLKKTEFPQGKRLTLWDSFDAINREKHSKMTIGNCSKCRIWTLRETGSHTRDLLP